VRAIYRLKHELEEQMQQNKTKLNLFLARNLQLQASDKGKVSTLVLMLDQSDFMAYHYVLYHVSTCVIDLHYECTI
jgi:hypothetical protein